MRMKTQRILAALLSLVLLLALAPAGWAVNFEQACKITVQPAASGEEGPKHEDGTTFIADINASTTPFVYDLYRVAYAKEVPGYDTYDYTLVAPFTSLDVKAEEPTQRNAEFWADLAQQAAKIALGLNEGSTQSTPIGAADSYTGNLMNTALTIPGYEVSADKTVSAGLYLVIARSSDYAWNQPAKYVVKEGNTISTLAHTDKWDYYYAPQLISIPTKEPIKEGDESVIKTSNPGEWIYNPTAVLKPTSKPRNGILKITKTLTNYADLSEEGSYFEPMTFTFSVVGRDKQGEGAKEVYRKVVALSVDTPVSEQEVVTLTDIPVGTYVTVKEIYSGAHATGQATGQQTIDPATGVIIHPEFQIQSPTVTGENGTMTVTSQVVKFTNVNNDKHRGGHGIENKFECDENGGWHWIANGEAQSDSSWSEEN